MVSGVSLEAWAAWSPGLESPSEWESWAKERSPLEASSGLPTLDFLPALFKRRLGQLDRMVLHVGYGVLNGRGPTRVVMASERGELFQQYRISADLVDSGEVSPTVFSHSVFNAPASLLSLALKNTGSASTVHAGPNSFIDAFLICLSMLERDPEPIALIVADEALPEAYLGLESRPAWAYAAAFMLGRGAAGRLFAEVGDFPPCSPALPDALSFLSFVLTGGESITLGAGPNGLAIRRAA